MNIVNYKDINALHKHRNLKKFVYLTCIINKNIVFFQHKIKGDV